MSDGEEILGIGDQGVGGISISIAKASMELLECLWDRQWLTIFEQLVLMTLCGGLHPNRTLPVVLDCGTDNKELLEDELYLGLRHSRVRGKQYGTRHCPPP